jgi:hypothetical protein
MNEKDLLRPERGPDETFEEYKQRRANANRYLKIQRQVKTVSYDSGKQFELTNKTTGKIVQPKRKGRPYVNPKRAERRAARGR